MAKEKAREPLAAGNARRKPKQQREPCDASPHLCLPRMGLMVGLAAQPKPFHTSTGL